MEDWHGDSCIEIRTKRMQVQFECRFRSVAGERVWKIATSFDRRGVDSYYTLEWIISEEALYRKGLSRWALELSELIEKRDGCWSNAWGFLPLFYFGNAIDQGNPARHWWRPRRPQVTKKSFWRVSGTRELTGHLVWSSTGQLEA